MEDKDELRKLRSKPAHIHFQINVPVWAPAYRTPDKAKEIIATMLEEMGLIEPSTIAKQ